MLKDWHFRILVSALIAALGLFCSGFLYLDTKKADKDAITVIREDVRDIKQYLLGHR